jgi:hypothetical protein
MDHEQEGEKPSAENATSKLELTSSTSDPQDVPNQASSSTNIANASTMVRQPSVAPNSAQVLIGPSVTSTSDEMERQDAAFSVSEAEFQDTLAHIQNDEALSKFRIEYEKMHKAVVRSRHHASILYKQFEAFQSEYNSNLSFNQESVKSSMQDEVILKNLKGQIKIAEDAIDASNKREEASKEELRILRQEIMTLSSTVKQGVGLSAMQERTLNELIAAKEASSRELETELENIVHLRNGISDVTDRIRVTDQQKRDREHEIYELKERNAAKKADIDAELRNKERLERDLRELRVVVAVKSQEVRGKQDAVNRSTDDISILESQIKSQKQMLEKLLKDQEGLEGRTLKLQQDCNEQITMTTQLIEENEALTKDLKVKEIELAKNKAEVKKVNKLRDALNKKNHAMEDQKVEAEHERRTLRAENETKLQEIERIKRSSDHVRKTIDDLTRERDILQNNSLKTTSETNKHINSSLLYKQTRHNLEVELSRDNKEVAELLKETNQLETERDYYVNEAAKLQALCVKGLQEIKEKELEIFEFKKKMIQADTKLKHQQNLYEAVQSDRNLHSKHLIESQAEISEMKRKLKIMNFQINGYKEDINAKDVALIKEVAENAKLEKDIEIITDEVKTLKNQNELAQAYIRSQLAEEMKLNQFVKEADLERSRQENALQVLISERDNLSAQLIRQNEELAKAYNQIKTQQSSLIRSERHYQERLKSIQQVLQEIRDLRDFDHALRDEISDLEPAKKAINRLQNEVTREKTRIKALEDELENPVNVHRWRKLEGGNPKAFEMIQLLHTLQKNLIAKTKEDKEKEELIQSKEQLYLHLKGILAKQVGPEAIEQVEEFQKILRDKQVQLKHMGVELNMYQAQVREYKHAIEVLNRSLQQCKEDYFDMRRGKHSTNTGLPPNYSISKGAKALAASLPKLSGSNANFADPLSSGFPLPPLLPGPHNLVAGKELPQDQSDIVVENIEYSSEEAGDEVPLVAI